MNNILELMSDSKQSHISVDQILSRIGCGAFNLDPPYQRDEVWKDKYKSDLIDSIMIGFPIGTLFFVDDPEGLIVLDGKQRISTIWEFMHQSSPSSLVSKKPIKSHYGTYKGMKDSDDKTLQEKIRRFHESSIPTVTVPPCDWGSQAKIFDRINQSVSLGTHEKIYCINFVVKSFLKCIHEKTIKMLYKFLPEKERKEHRYAHLRFLHVILAVAFGRYIKENCNLNPSLEKSLLKCAIDLQEYLIQNGYGVNSGDDYELLKKIGMLKNIELLESVCKTLRNVLGFKHHTWNKVVIRDIILFTIQKSDADLVTLSQIKDKTQEFYSAFCDYEKEWIKISNEKTSSGLATNNVDVFKLRHEILLDCVSNINGLDLCVKNREFSIQEKEKAHKESTGFCPICERELTSENSVVDHLYPKSKFSNTKGVVICKICNAEKSNYTLEQLEEKRIWNEAKMKNLKKLTESPSTPCDDGFLFVSR